MNKARIAGVFYVLTFIGGIYSLVVGGRSGAAAGLIAAASYIAVTIVFYYLFKPVNRGLSLLAAIISFAGCVAGSLGGNPLAPAFLNALVFFGFYCLLIGYLILKSTFVPAALGALMMFAGLGWLTFFSSRLATALYPYILAPGIIGEGALTVWLLVGHTRMTGVKV